MDKEKLRNEMFQILDKMMMCAEAEMYEEVKMLNEKIFIPKEKELFHDGMNGEYNKKEAVLFDLARNNILNACKNDHVLSSEEFLKKAKELINQTEVLIHEKKKEILNLLKKARELAINGKFSETKELLSVCASLMHSVFGSSKSVQAMEFDMARNKINGVLFQDVPDKEQMKIIQDIMAKGLAESEIYIRQLEKELEEI